MQLDRTHIDVMELMSDERITFTVEKAGERLDKIIVPRLPQYSRSQIQDLIDAGHILVDDEQMKSGNRLKGGEEIVITLPADDDDERIEPEQIPLEVVYEDETIAVVNKPAGMVVHPGYGHEDGTLVNALLHRYPELAAMRDDPQAEGRMGIVHRLDKNTSGILVTARNLAALHHLMAQFKERSVEKTYIALLERAPDTDVGLIDAPIGRDPQQRKRMAVVRGGKPATTEYEVLEEGFRDGQVLVKVRLHSGRTHQIRVHMAFINCPVVGDTVYGFNRQRVGLKRLFLHAAELGFEHPVTGERVVFRTDLPAGLQDLLAKLR